MGQDAAPFAVHPAIDIGDPFVSGDGSTLKPPGVLAASRNRCDVAQVVGVIYRLRHRVVRKTAGRDQAQHLLCRQGATFRCDKYPVICNTLSDLIRIVADHRRVEGLFGGFKLHLTIIVHPAFSSYQRDCISVGAILNAPLGARHAAGVLVIDGSLENLECRGHQMIRKGSIQGPMANQQPVKDRSVDDVQNNVDVAWFGDVTLFSGPLNQAPPCFPTGQDHMVAKCLRHFAFRVCRRECHGDLSAPRRRECFHQRSHLRGQAGLQGAVPLE